MKKIFRDINCFVGDQYCPFCNKKCNRSFQDPCLLDYSYKEVSCVYCLSCKWSYSRNLFRINNIDYILQIKFPFIGKSNCFQSKILNISYDLKSYEYFVDEKLLNEDSSKYEYRSYLIDYYLAYSKNLIFL
jgi:hypothetical protein